MLKIAVDARPLSKPMSGIGRYLFNALKNLIPSDTTIYWFLYTDSPILLKNEFFFDNATVRFDKFFSQKLRNKKYSIYSFIFSQTVFPIWCLKDKVTVFWSPRHHFPLLLPWWLRKVLTVHDLVWRYYPKTMVKASYVLEKVLMPIAIKKADSIVTVSCCTRESLISYIPSSVDKMYMIYPNFNNINLNNASYKVHNKPFLLFVGTLEPRKNLRRLLVAYSSLIESNDIIDDLVLVGSGGWGNQNIFSLVDKLNLSGRVILVGYTTDEVLSLYYQQANLLILPSLYEGFGLTALEAMNVGTPVLTSNVSSMPEVSGIFSSIIDPLSISSIEQALFKFYNDQEFRRILKNLVIRELKKFDNRTSTKKLLKVLKGGSVCN